MHRFQSLFAIAFSLVLIVGCSGDRSQTADDSAVSKISESEITDKVLMKDRKQEKKENRKLIWTVDFEFQIKKV